jgi:hypothetical protein
MDFAIPSPPISHIDVVGTADYTYQRISSEKSKIENRSSPTTLKPHHHRYRSGDRMSIHPIARILL